MNIPSQVKQPSTYAGLGIIFSAIPQLLETQGQDGTAWAQVVMGLIAIFKNEGNTI